jgi:hypothetical protein
MAIDGTEVRVAGAGHVYAAPASTALPTDLDPLAADWVDLGYVTEDGVGFTFGRETEAINAWQGSKVRVVTTAEPASTNFALMQSNAETLKVAFGGGTVTADAGVYTYEPPASGTNTERALVIEFNDGDINYRYCLARVELEGNIEFTLTKAGAVTYPVTFGVLDNGDDPKYTIVTDDPAFSGS